MWSPTVDKKYGVAIYNFNCKANKECLQLEIGETVHIIEECQGWFRGFTLSNKDKKGLFPASYIHIKSCRVDNEGPYETVTSCEDSTVKELTYAIREWYTLWRIYYHKNNQEFYRLQREIEDVTEYRKNLLSQTLTKDQLLELKCEATNAVNNINHKHKLDLIPSKDGEPIDPEKTSPVELYRILVKTSFIQKAPFASVRNTTIDLGAIRKTFSHHILLRITSFPFTLNEETETYFSLYDPQAQKFISERFVISRTKSGMAIDKASPDCALFVDLSNDNICQDVYLVAHIHRIGRMIIKDKEKAKLPSDYRRPLGCAVLNLRDLLFKAIDQNDAVPYSMRVQMLEKESDFSQLHEQLLKKPHTKASPAVNQYDLGLNVELRRYGENLSKLRKEQPLLFTKNIALTKKLGFPEIIMPGDVRNDLYITINHGDFYEKDRKSTGKNVEVRVQVLDNLGHVLKGTISHGTGRPMLDEYRSFIYYHNNSPCWLETLKVSVPMERFPDCHVRFEFRHCSNTTPNSARKMFTFGFLRLADSDGTIIKDGNYELILFKCEDVSKLTDVKYYVDNLVSNVVEEKTDARYQDNHTFFKRNQRDRCYVDTLLCSTKLTQNSDLLSLLQWRNYPHDVENILGKLRNLPEKEIVKLLQDILDALFSMFSDDSAKVHAQTIFHSLVDIFTLLTDVKYEHFQTVVTTYLKDHFSASLVYRDLLECLKTVVDNVLRINNQDSCQKTFKVLEYIFKFVVQSMILYKRASGGDHVEEFTSHLKEVVSSMQKVLELNALNNNICSTQGILLENFKLTFDDLLEVIPASILAEMICSVISKMPKEPANTSSSQSISVVKLKCLHAAIKNEELFADAASRSMLMSQCLSQLKRFLVEETELQLCADVLADIIVYLHADQTSEAKQHVKTLVVALLQPVIQVILVLSRTRLRTMGAYVSNLIGMLRLMDENHYRDFLDQFPANEVLKEFLIKLMSVFIQLVIEDLFPRGWWDMKMVINNVILTTTQYLSQTLTEKFTEGEYFDKELWTHYFNLAVKFVTQPSLQLETFAKTKQERLIERYNDMRVPMGYETVGMWESLDLHKIEFVPSMVGPFLELTMVSQTEVREYTLPIFFDMMECEYTYYGNFSQVESELIDKLDILIGANRGDEAYTRLFNVKLLEKVQESYLGKDAEKFVNSVTTLLERLMDYRQVVAVDESMVTHKKISCTMNLLNFYKTDINREDMYVRYIYKLADLHLAVNNYAEAAFTLKCHAEMLDWTNVILDADKQYPRETEWQRKENLYKKIIECFNKGQTWEYGVSFCKELGSVYETRLYDYKKLSGILETLASFYNHIMNDIRLESGYYKVGFYGMTFPSFLRNKVFVYRGQTLERLGPFSKRIQSEYPGAMVMTSNSPPDQMTMEGELQYIQICNVKPVAKEQASLSDGLVPAPDKIKCFYSTNEVDEFTYDRPIHRGKKDPKNEFKTLCLERTHLKITSKLPSIVRWFEVCNTRTVILSPIETAIDTMEIKNEELRLSVETYDKGQESSLNPLTMRLNGIIDAAVNGGISNYQEAFFTTDFVMKYPEQSKLIVKLKLLFLDQIHILEKGLVIHGKMVPEDIQPLHKRMVTLFADMKAGFDDQGSPDAGKLSLPRGSLPPSEELSAVLMPMFGSSSTLKSSESASPASSQCSSTRSSLYADIPGSSEEAPGRPMEAHKKATSDSNLMMKSTTHERVEISYDRRKTHHFEGNSSSPMLPSRQISSPCPTSTSHSKTNVSPAIPERVMSPTSDHNVPPIPIRLTDGKKKPTDELMTNGNRSSTSSTDSETICPSAPPVPGRQAKVNTTNSNPPPAAHHILPKGYVAPRSSVKQGSPRDSEPLLAVPEAIEQSSAQTPPPVPSKRKGTVKEVIKQIIIKDEVNDNQPESVTSPSKIHPSNSLKVTSRKSPERKNSDPPPLPNKPLSFRVSHKDNYDNQHRKLSDGNCIIKENNNDTSGPPPVPSRDSPQKGSVESVRNMFERPAVPKREPTVPPPRLPPRKTLSVDQDDTKM